MAHKFYSVFIILLLVMTQCSRPKPAEPAAVPPETPTTSQEVSGLISDTICGRAVECVPEDAVVVSDCVAQTRASLDGLMTEKAIVMSRGELDTCVQSIKSAPCEVILNPDAPPKGCEKLQ